MALEKCDDCNEIAVWFYMPGSGKYCEKHCPRGCSCNQYHKDEYPPDEEDIEDGIKWDGDYWFRVDEEGRAYPCCEYEYEKDGWDYSEDDIDDIDEDEQKNKN